MERFARQIMLPEIGEKGQKKLSNASVLIVGLGGLGCPVSLYLTGAGVGRIGLCDSDRVSISNLPRQLLYNKKQAGTPKTEAAFCRLSQISPNTEFDLWHDGLNDRNANRIISQYDFVVDCTDNHAIRYLIDDICTSLGKRWVYGAIGAYEGHVSTFDPQSARYSDIFPNRLELSVSPHIATGVIGPLPGIIGSIQAAEAIKLICGFGDLLIGRLLLFNLIHLTFDTIEI